MKYLVITLVICGCLSSFKAYSQQLAIAVQKNDLVKVQKLIDKGVNINEHSRNECYPLMNAVMNKNAKMVELLLKNGAKSDMCPEIRHGKYTPFYEAIKLNQIDLVKVFCENGYDVKMKMCGKKYTYPIIIAATYEKLDILNFLIEKGVDITVYDFLLKNALMYSVSANNLEITEILLSKGCPLNETSSDRFTPLMYAVEDIRVKSEIVNLLLSKGANLNYTNNLNQSAFTIACNHNNRVAALILIEHGAKGKDSETDFLFNARMNHFLGDYYLAIGDLINSKGYYSKAKKFYNECLEDGEMKISRINSKKTGDFLKNAVFTGVVGATVISLTSDLYDMDSKAITNHIPKYYKSDKNKFLSYDFQRPANGSLDQMKEYCENTNKQYEMSIDLIDCILTCIEKGLTGQELNSCIEELQQKKK